MGLADTDSGAARIVLGGRFGEEDPAVSVARLDRFRDRGGRLVETAHSYAAGRAEEVVGGWLRRRPDMVLVDKVGHPREDGTLDLTPPALRAEVAESLRRLGTDHVGVVLLHRDDPRRPVPELVGVLAGLVADGLAGRVGVTNWSAPRLAEALAVSATARLRPVLSYHLSLATPVRPVWPGTRHADPDVLALADRYGTPLLAWAAHAGGWFAAGDGPDPRWAAFDAPANRAARDRCRRVAARLGLRPEAVALAWTLSRPRVRAVVGPANVAELDVSLDAAELELPADVLAELAGEQR